MKVAALHGGGFVATWDTSTGHVEGRVFAASGQPGNVFQVQADASDFGGSAEVATLSNGGFVVTWTVSDFAGTTVAGQVFAPDGTKVGTQFEINAPGQSGKEPEVTATADGGFVVAWQAETGSQSGFFSDGIRMRSFDASGSATSEVVLVSAVGSEPAVTTLANGDVVVSWLQANPATNGRTEIHTQLYSLASSTGTAGNDTLTAPPATTR